MGRAVRRAAGTVTFSDVFRDPKRMLWQFTPRGAAVAAADLEAFAAGEARAVAAHAYKNRRMRQGLLVLDPASPTSLAWHRTMRPRPGGSPVALEAPFDVHAATPGVPLSRYTLLTFTAATTPWALAVPVRDIPLVRAALIRANAQA
ncbi:hypothetical protein [Streptomyces sp. NRRL F-5123]|uniref:hypothetical protein n=1 Tax=Streptomyces sp. NRRL F-5123 TaxID=1463856 RepID=UPI0004E14A86|nr:hypothetical protein [Streptomyces sp. NRRL F-5123]